MNSFLSWTEKYQPSKARFMIGDRVKIKKLFTWLNSWKERHEAIVKKMAARAVKKLVFCLKIDKKKYFKSFVPKKQRSKRLIRSEASHNGIFCIW